MTSNAKRGPAGEIEVVSESVDALIARMIARRNELTAEAIRLGAPKGMDDRLAWAAAVSAPNF